MDNRDILIFIFIIAFMYHTYKLNKIEHFDTTQDQINATIKRMYLADIEAIRTLSNFAIQLSQGNTTISGNVTFSGNTTTSGNSTTNGNSIINGNSTINGNLTISGNILLSGNKMIDFGFNDTSRNTDAGKISYGLLNADALSIVGKGTSTNNRKVKILDNVEIPGSLKIGNWTISQDVSGQSIFTNSINGTGIVKFGNDGNIWVAPKQKWLTNAFFDRDNFSFTNTTNCIRVFYMGGNDDGSQFIGKFYSNCTTLPFGNFENIFKLYKR